MNISISRTEDLFAEDRRRVSDLCSLAFGEPFDELFGLVGPSGVHVMLSDGSGELSSHCVVTERTFWLGERQPVRAGYVDAVATRPACQGMGYGRVVVAEACRLCKDMGMKIVGLSTHIPEWYGSMGWKLWIGDLWLKDGDEIIPTPEIDGVAMVYDLDDADKLDVRQRLIASWRPGGGW